MSNMDQERAIEIAQNRSSATDAELQDAHRALNVRGDEMACGVNLHMRPMAAVRKDAAKEGLSGVIFSLTDLKKFKGVIAQELQGREVSHRTLRPARAAAQLAAMSR